MIVEIMVDSICVDFVKAFDHNLELRDLYYNGL